MKQLLQPSLWCLTLLLLTGSFLSATAEEELHEKSISVNHVRYVIKYTGEGANAQGKEAHVWHWESGVAKNLTIESSVSAEITYIDENQQERTKTISAPVKVIMGKAFTSWNGQDCPVTDITIPNTVIEINGTDTFGSSIKSITIGSSIKRIGQQVFDHNLEMITCYATTPPIIDGITFNNYSAKVYVPDNSVNDYKVHQVWGLFEDNIKGISTNKGYEKTGGSQANSKRMNSNH